MKDQYNTLIKYLKQIHREGCKIEDWIPDYGVSNGKRTGKGWINVEFIEPGYSYFDGQLFPIGSKLTSKENGELIIAPPGTPDELIVGIVK